jgi:hypothetical protein
VLLDRAPKTGVRLLMPHLGEAVEPSHVDGVVPWWRGVDKDAARPQHDAPSLPKAMPWPID